MTKPKKDPGAEITKRMREIDERYSDPTKLNAREKEDLKRAVDSLKKRQDKRKTRLDNNS